MKKQDVVRQILAMKNHGSFVNAEGGYAWAPANVALCKYWGKRDVELHLPVTSSLSVSLDKKGAFTHIMQTGTKDVYYVNGEVLPADSKFALRLSNFLDLFRPTPDVHYLLDTTSTVPIAAGFASSASGFAALVQALNYLYDWRLSKIELSILARLGSGSACRSLWDGFVEWQAGELADGMDSHGVPMVDNWPELRIGALMLVRGEKSISSTAAMQKTVETSPLYEDWPQQVKQDLADIKRAISERKFGFLGETMEMNALEMHAMMATADPIIIYSTAETYAAMDKVQELRKQGIPVFFTQDAGPNLQILFLANDEETVLRTFPQMEIIVPFADITAERVVLVDERDVELGCEEKIIAHLRGDLHRAFSVFILRQRDGKTQLLLQQRDAGKYHSGGLWSNTCCGHPRPGEDIVMAGRRRLQEEMGFDTAELRDVAILRYRTLLRDVKMIENELDHILVGYANPRDFTVNAQEVSDYCWKDLSEIEADLMENPGKYTAWFARALQALMQSVRIH